MSLICPECHSTHIEKRGPARRAGSIIGTIGGASTGFRSALLGAEVGAQVSRLAGPIGMATGSLVGAIVGELPTGAVAGLGARLLSGSYYGQTIQIWAALFMAAAVAALLVSLVGVAHRMVLKRMGEKA